MRCASGKPDAGIRGVAGENDVAFGRFTLRLVEDAAVQRIAVIGWVERVTEHGTKFCVEIKSGTDIGDYSAVPADKGIDC